MMPYLQLELDRAAEQFRRNIRSSKFFKRESNKKFLSSQLAEITNLFQGRLCSISIAYTSTYKICSDAKLNFVLTHNPARNLRFVIHVWGSVKNPRVLACVQTSPPPSGKIGRRDVCESPSLICIHYFVLSVTVEKAHVGRKIALASVHRLAEHLHAMSTQKSRCKISNYSQARSSVPPKIPLMFLLFES